MIHVAFPAPQFKVKTKGEERYIFDEIRKKWLRLTGEEWVRQNMVAYLTHVLRFPKEAIALEKGIAVNGLKKRFDILLYNKNHQPWMIVECKAPEVDLDENVLQQAMRYSIAVPVSWIVLTNGLKTVAWRKEKDSLLFMPSLPEWSE